MLLHTCISAPVSKIKLFCKGYSLGAVVADREETVKEPWLLGKDADRDCLHDKGRSIEAQTWLTVSLRQGISSFSLT